MANAVKVDHVNKTIRGHEILKDVSLVVECDSSIGLIGRNGSGKSMLLKAICGLIIPNSGSIEVFDKPVGKNGKFAQDTGILVENPGFLPQYSALANLKMLAAIQKKINIQQIKDTIETVGLDPADKRPVRKYSMGMKQRLAIAQALMEKPKLLILDQPMNGLDVQGVEDMYNVLSDLNKQGTTMILTSHHAIDIERLCSKVYMMDRGVLSEG